MRTFKPLFFSSITIAAFLFIISCSSNTPHKEPQPESTPHPPAVQEPGNAGASSQLPQIHSDNIEVKTFEVNDNTGKAKGWGYDIYVDGKKMIHQPIIPAVPGNDAFKTESDARKTGVLAADKMKKSGSLPTITVNELDSLGIIKK